MKIPFQVLQGDLYKIRINTNILKLIMFSDSPTYRPITDSPNRDGTFIHSLLTKNIIHSLLLSTDSKTGTIDPISKLHVKIVQHPQP